LKDKYFSTLQSSTTLRRIREQSDRPGFSSFLVTFFFSLHKEKKKVTKRFEIKEESYLKVNLVLLELNESELNSIGF
jgi:hypothetical protein